MNFLNELNAEKQKSEDTRGESSAFFGSKVNPLLKEEDKNETNSNGGGINWLSNNEKKEEKNEGIGTMWPSAHD